MPLHLGLQETWDIQQSKILQRKLAPQCGCGSFHTNGLQLILIFELAICFNIFIYYF